MSRGLHGSSRCLRAGADQDITRISSDVMALVLLLTSVPVRMAPVRILSPGSPPVHLQKLSSASHPQMMAQSDESEFDLGAEQWDLLEGRAFKRETLLKYGLTNRVEQLRLLFFASSAVVGATFPWLASELFFTSANTVDMSVIAASAASAIGFGLFTVGEKKSRGRKLLRIERELAVSKLSVWQPNNPLGAQGRSSVEALQGKRRVLAICAPPAVLTSAIESIAVYRRRLGEAGVVLVAIAPPGDDSSAAAAAWEAASTVAEREGWLWQPTSAREWHAYFVELLGSRASLDGGAFFALSLRGKSVGSGLGVPPWDELLGTRLPPLGALSPDAAADEAASPSERSVLAAQEKLYDAITSADAEAVRALCVSEDDAEVSALQQAGRLDSWSVVLQGSATVGMRLASQDARVSADGLEAWSTGLEFPTAGGSVAAASASVTGSLLCTQRWVNVAQGAAAQEPEWRLAQHRTIPFAEGFDAPACLRCDRRGCVALQRVGARGAPGMPGDGRS